MNTGNMSNYKTWLEREKELTEKQLAALEKDQHRSSGPLPADFSDQVVEMENNEVIDALAISDDVKLRLINSALNRMENETFGICTSCEEKISESRLNAIPFAESCVKCAD